MYWALWYVPPAFRLAFLRGFFFQVHLHVSISISIYHFFHQSIYPPRHLPADLHAYIPINLSICPINPTISPSFCLSVHLSILLPIHVSFHLSVYLSICLPVYLSTHLPIYLSLSLPLYLPIYLSTCLSVSVSTYKSINLDISLSIFWCLGDLGFRIRGFVPLCSPSRGPQEALSK